MDYIHAQKTPAPKNLKSRKQKAQKFAAQTRSKRNFSSFAYRKFFGLFQY